VAVPTGGRGARVLGVAQVGQHRVALPAEDARQHLHIVGKTGVGKSTLLANMVLADVQAGRGAVVIDPRGDLILDILDRLPATVADRVVIIDPDQPGHTGWNPLEGDDEHLAVDNVVSVFAKIFAKFWGPRMDDTLRVSLLTLRAHANATLSEVPPLLNSDTFRAQFTSDLDDPAGLHGYWAWYDSMNPAQRAQVIGPVLARMRQFLLRPFVMQTIGSPKSTFDMGTVLDGGLLLCRLPKGQLGEDTTRVLGSLLVARMWQAATARTAQPEHTRRDRRQPPAVTPARSERVLHPAGVAHPHPPGHGATGLVVGAAGRRRVRRRHTRRVRDLVRRARAVSFFLEYETGLQRPARLEPRLDDYRSLPDQQRHPVVIWVPTTGHETTVHRVLGPHTSGLTVVTGLHDDNPAGTCLLPVAVPATRRLPIADLRHPSG
jgi:hypothetical protein